jgi:hypothetical protein
VDALAVVVHRHRELLLGGLLPDHVLIQEFLHLERLGELVGAGGGLLGLIVFENRVANGYALVTDVRTGIIAGGGDQLPDYILALMTERASQGFI